MAKILGTPPGWRVDSYRVDRNGAATVELVKPWEPILTPDGAGMLALPDLPVAPLVTGFAVSGLGWRRQPGGGMEVTASYQGYQPLAPDGSSPMTPRGEDEPGATWSLSGSLYQKDVRAVANWDEVKKQYEWDTARQEFPDFLSKLSEVTSTWTKNPDGKDVKLNPARGVRSVDDFSGTLTKTFLAKEVPEYIFSRIGWVVNRAGPVPVLKGRNWKYMAPDFEPHGDFFRIMEHLELSGPGGWDKLLYKNRAGEAG